MSDEELAELKAELAKPAYTGLTHQQAAAVLRAIVILRQRIYRATLGSLMQDLTMVQFVNIMDALDAASATNPQARWFLEALKHPEGAADMGLNKMQSLMTDFQTALVFTSPQANALKGLSTENISPWANIRAHQVESARG